MYKSKPDFPHMDIPPLKGCFTPDLQVQVFEICCTLSGADWILRKVG